MEFFIVFMIFKAIQAQYHFKNSEDREICAQANFVDISPYRVVSLTQMSWQSAHACCKLKGRILHTIEKSVESDQYPLHKVLIEKIGVVAEDIQFWIGLSYHKNNFQWSFGSVFSTKYKKVERETYIWVDGHPEMSLSSSCVTISPYRDMLEMRTVSCNTILNFICQKIPRMDGELLSGQDMMIIGSAKFMDVPGFRNLKFSTTFTRWHLANAICQARNGALIDRVHERYGDKLSRVIKTPKYMFNKHSKIIHSSGNDFCQALTWEWACGEKIVSNIPFQNHTSRSRPKKKTDKHCLQYTVQRIDRSNSKFIAASVGCNELGYVICNTKPSCVVNDQYRCLHKDPYFIDVENNAKTDEEVCRKSEFYEVRSPSKNISYWISLSKLSWLGANNCCKAREWLSIAPKTVNELEFLAAILRTFIDGVCQDEKLCDGFWTSTSTMNYSPHSPLRFMNGKLLSRSLYSLIRADAFSYPSCGRINFMDEERSHIKYVHADCLENNLVICETNQKEKHYVKVRKVLDEVGFVESTSSKTYSDSPNDEHLKNLMENHYMDLCPNQQEYSKFCPNSSTKIGTPGNVKQNPPNETSQIQIPFQNQKILLEQFVQHALYQTNETVFQVYGFQFLEASVELFAKLCPIVPFSFLMNALEMFRRLHLIMNPKRKPEIIKEEDFDWTMKLLDVCGEHLKPVNIKYDSCGDWIIAEANCNNFICTEPEFEFNMYKSDLLLDIIWKVFEVIHSVCFPAFNQENARLHHKYAITILDLWESEEIRLRWYWATQVEDKIFWKRLLGPFFEEHAINMERCSAATIANSYFHVRLSKALVPRTVRMRGFKY